MSSKLRKVLLAVGDDTLQKLIGAQTVHLLSLIDERAISSQKLIELLEARYGDAMLLHPPVREAVLLALSKSDAIDLMQRIAGKADAVPWKALLGYNYQPGSSALRELYNWFGIELTALLAPEVAPSALSSIEVGYPLYPYQIDVVHRSLKRLHEGDRRVLIHMPTGAGKTRSAMALIARFLIESEHRGLVIWLAHSEELCDQAAEEFQKCWANLGNCKLTLARFYSTYEFKLDQITEGVIVAGLPKLYSRSFSEQSRFLHLKRSTHLVVMDEAHQAVAPTYQHLLEMLAPKGGEAALIGLSATPGRSWLDIEEDEKLADFFSRSKVELQIPGYANPIEFLQENGYLARPEYKHIPYRPSLQLTDTDLRRLADGFDLSPETLRRLGEDETRNLLILREVLSEVASGSKIVVFACSVEHAYLIADTLRLKGVAAAAVSSETPIGARRRAIELFRGEGDDALQVIVNYGILTTGFDAPKTNVAVIARPTRSVVLYSQMIGRAMRGPLVGGNADCRIYTVVDHLPGFRNIYEGFSYWEDIWRS